MEVRSDSCHNDSAAIAHCALSIVPIHAEPPKVEIQGKIHEMTGSRQPLDRPVVSINTVFNTPASLPVCTYAVLHCTIYSLRTHYPGNRVFQCSAKFFLSVWNRNKIAGTTGTR